MATLFHGWSARLNSDQRLASIFKGSATGMLARLVSIGVSAITLPLNVRYMGREEYGIWATVSGTVVMLNLLDLGIASTLTNFLSRAYAGNDRREAQHSYATAFWLTTVIVCVLGAAFALAWSHVSWGALLRVSNPVVLREAKRSIIIAVVACLINLPLNLAGKIAGAYRELHVYNYTTIVGSFLALAAVIVGVSLRFSLSHLVMGFCLASVASTVVANVWVVLVRRPWLAPLPWRTSVGRARELFGQGSLFFVIQLCGVIVFNSDNLVITHYLGPEQVTPYAVAWRLASYAFLLQQLVQPAAWPALSEAYQAGDIEWVRSTYRSINHKTLLAVGSIVLGTGLFGRWFIGVWAGQIAQPGYGLMWTMALWAFLATITSNQALLLSAVGRLKLEASVAVLAAIVNITLSIILVQRIGSIGVILATTLSFLVLMLGPQEWEVRKVLRGDFMTSPAKRSPQTVEVA